MYRQIHEGYDVNGKILAGAIVTIALIFGAAVYYFQVYYFYEKYPVEAEKSIPILSQNGVQPIQAKVSNYRAIDAESSPIRYRACFETGSDLSAFSEKFQQYEPELAEYGPRNAPRWFDCFDAAKIGALIAEGNAEVFTSQRNIHFGIDRVIAITSEGTGFVWHELTACGKKTYDGTPLGKDCPPHF